MVSYARARNIKEGVLAAARVGQTALSQARRGLAGSHINPLGLVIGSVKARRLW